MAYTIVPAAPAAPTGPDVSGSAAAHAQQKGYNTGGWQVMQEGTITYQNGVPGFMVKYIDSQGRTTTEWTQLQGGAGGLTNVPMSSGPGGSSGLLTSSPYYQQTLAAVNAAAAADAAARRGGVQQALIGFGEVPGTFADKYGDIDALTRSLAEKNTTSGISSKARLLQARKDAISQYTRRLSSKGLRRSGAKGYGLRRRQLEFDQSYSDALGKLLGYTGGLYSQFAGNEYQRQLALAQALAYASQNLGDFGLGGGGRGGGGGGGGGGEEVTGTGFDLWPADVGGQPFQIPSQMRQPSVTIHMDDQVMAAIGDPWSSDGPSQEPIRLRR